MKNNQLTSIAIIPARGGSKRIPLKNIKNFLGNPIICYPIKAAFDSHCFEEIMVSTDDQDIAEISLKLGASVPFIRSGKNSNDYATTVDVLLEVLEEYRKIGREFDLVCCLYPTSVFVTAKLLKQAKNNLLNTGVNGVASIIKYSHPIEQALILNKNKQISYKYQQHSKTRTQDLVSHFHDAGQLYYLKAKPLLAEKKIFMSKMQPIILRNSEVQDIDTLDDWVVAEMKAKNVI